MNQYPTVRQLKQNEPIPYRLLLLADEEVQAIDQYIGKSDVYVAELICKVMGVYALYPLNAEAAEIKAIAVDPDYQNIGIGKFLLNHAAIEAQRKGFKELVIGTPTIAEKQLSIYRKAGFVQFDVKENFFVDHYIMPIFEDGKQLRDMAMLKKYLDGKSGNIHPRLAK